MIKITKILLIIILVGLASRAAFFLAVRPWDPGVLSRQILVDDAAGYHAIAEGLLQTRSFTNDPTAHRTPGYPLYLAFIYALFGARPWIAILLQVVMNTAAILLVYLLAQKYFSETTALIASFLYAVEPHAVTYCSYLLTETLFSLLFLGSLYALVRGLDAPFRTGWFSVSGLLLGAATMVRPVAQFFTFIAMILILVRFRRQFTLALRPALLLISLFAVAVLPWAVRNHVSYGHFAFSTIGTAKLLYYDAAYTEHARTGEDVSAIVQRLREQAMAAVPAGEQNPFVIAAAENRVAMSYIKAHPVPFLKSYLRGSMNMYLNLTASQTCALLGIPKVERSYDFLAFTSYREMIRWFFTYKNVYEITIGIAIALFLIIVYLSTAFGAWTAFKDHRYFFLLLAGSTILYFSLVTGTVGVSRMKLPFMPLYLILAAEGLRRCLTRGKLQSGL